MSHYDMEGNALPSISNPVPAVDQTPFGAATVPVVKAASGRRLFGTDGVRGVANSELTSEMALALGSAAARILMAERPGGKRCRVVVGRDPRISGDLLGAALMAGLCSEGVDVLDIGILPTPGVAFAARRSGAAAGIVLSASHNPLADNGIKFFGADGKKLSDATEERIEAAMGRPSSGRPTGGEVGRIIRRDDLISTYADDLAGTCGETRFEGLKLVVDCANGSASPIAAAILTGLGATVASLSSEPDGLNINENCGSLHPEHMASEVVRLGFDAGLAFDGDADRVILCDHKGRIFDGDRILCTVGIALQAEGALPGNVVVGTVMSNLGLEKALERHGIQLLRASVGDRYVGEMMRSHGATIGGEKSGHILFPRITTTGDGILTALQVLCIGLNSGRSLSSWADEMQEFPQRLVNIRVRERDGWEEIEAIATALRSAERQLAGRGRIFVRPSGTEKMIRVMAEGPDAAEVDALVESVASTVRTNLGV